MPLFFFHWSRDRNDHGSALFGRDSVGERSRVESKCCSETSSENDLPFPSTQAALLLKSQSVRVLLFFFVFVFWQQVEYIMFAIFINHVQFCCELRHTCPFHAALSPTHTWRYCPFLTQWGLLHLKAACKTAQSSIWVTAGLTVHVLVCLDWLLVMGLEPLDGWAVWLLSSVITASHNVPI